MGIYNFFETIEDPSIITETISIFSIISGISSIIGLILYILQAIGLYKMGKNLQISAPWLSFIPIVNSYTFGKIASRYVKRDGKSSAKFEIWLLAIQILMSIVAILLIVLMVISLVTIIGFLQASIEDNSALTLEMFSSFIPVIILYVVTLGLALAYNIIYYVALWRIVSIYSAENATVFTVLSVFFNFLPPIFIFILRNVKPACTYAERMGFEEV